MNELRETKSSFFEKEVEQTFWVDVMVEEYESIMKNNVWELVPRPTYKSVVRSRWIFKVKHVANGSIEKYKARFVAKGFSEVGGIYYEETFAPVASSFKEELEREFDMKNMGLMNYFLKLEVWQGDGELFVSQGKYAIKILQRFHVESCKPMETPLATNWRKDNAISGKEVDATIYQKLVGSLMYLVNTLSDMCYVVSQLKQAIFRLTKLCWKATKHVLRYLRGTTQYGLWYRRAEGVKLFGFTDADWVGSPSDQKSISSGIFNFGSAAISWYSKKQKYVALSSVEVEYMAASQATCEVIWMKKILVGLFGQEMDPTVIYCDNQSCIKLYDNLVINDRSKHIDIWYQHLRYCVQRRIMFLQYISTEEQDANILTKDLSRGVFEVHRCRIGVVDNPFLAMREC
eukprot:PITA_11235